MATASKWTRALIWSLDKKIRLIGNDCAKNYFGEEFERIHAEFSERSTAESNIDFLLENLKLVPYLLDEAEKLSA